MGYLGPSPSDEALKIGDDVILSSHINDGVIVNADINASAAIAMSKTTLVGGAGLTLSTNTLSVDADQSGQITSVGTLTGLTTSGNLIINHDGANSLRLGASADLQLYHNGSTSAVTNATGILYFWNNANANTVIGSNNTESIVCTGANTTFRGTGDFAGQLTVTANTLINPSASTSSYLQFATGGTTYGYVGSESSIVSGGTASDMTIGASGDTNLTLTTNGAVRATLNSSGATFAGKVSLGTQTNGVNSFTTNRARFGGHATSIADVLYNAYWNGSAWINDDDSSDSYLLRLQHDVGLLFQVSEAQATPSFSTKFSITNDGNATFAGGITLAQGGSASNNSIYHHPSNNWMYVQGGTAGLALKGEDSDDSCVYLNNASQNISLNTNNVNRLLVNNTTVTVASASNLIIDGGNLEQRANTGTGSFVRQVRHEMGAKSGDAYIYITTDNWRPVIYSIRLCGHNGNGHFEGSFYGYSGVLNHDVTIAETNGNVGSLSIVDYDASNEHRLKFNIPLTGDVTHPLLVAEFTTGGYGTAGISDISMDIS